MKSGFEIAKEPDPILREIYAMGYDEAIVDKCTQNVVMLIKDKNYIKEVPVRDLKQSNFSVMGGVLPDGNRHYWIKEGDGSCERLRNIIKPELNGL